MRLRRLLVLLLAASALAACAQQVPRYAAAPPARYEVRSDLDARIYGAPQRAAYAMAQAPKVVPVRAVKPVAERPYTLDAGDKLRVVVFGQDALSNNYTVGADGTVTLPLIGAVPARGLTTTQLSGAIALKLRQDYIRDPSVAVEVETYRPFFVLGEVAYPGQYPYVPNMTVEAAIAVAGGFTPRADKDRVVVNRNARGATARYSMTLQHPVRPGDTVTVSERWF
ncbi:MAG: polysaccharide biosynthesis/export family protein [Xanthobacteraceae bacterium]